MIKPVSGLASEGVAGGQAKANVPAIESAARQFEALLIAQLIRSARGDDTEGWLGAGEEQTASSVLALAEEQFASALASRGGLGLAGMIVKQMAETTR